MKGSRRRFTIQAIVWLVVMVAAIIFLPNISSLVRDKGQTKLPSSAKSQVAQVIQNHWGRNQNNTRQVVVVFNNGDSPLTSDQKQAIDGTIQRFKVQKSKYHVKSMTAASDNAAAKKQLISKDKSTQLLQLMVGKNQTVANMTKNITAGAKTAGVKTYVTGSDILNDDFTQETEAGIQKTEIITVIFIFIVLTLVFRSPITPLVSLLSVGVSFIISLSVVMNLVNKFNFPLSNFTQVFMVVVLFGIGTDYNILLFDQFKEELSHGDSPVAATGRALKIAGRTILYSGSSLLIGFSALGLANFSIYKSAVGVAIAVAILLLVLLTLNPFFMALLGPRLFWPTKKFAGGSTSKMWHGIAASSVRYPIIALIVVLGVSLPFILTYNNELNYDTLAELNDTIPAKKGFQVVQDHFSKGTAEPSTLYIKTDHALNNEKDLKVIDSLTKQLQKVKGVKTVASVTQPGGSQIDQLYVGNQLGTVTSGMKSASKGLTKIGSGLDSANSKLKSANMSDSAKSAKKLADGADEVASGVVSYTDGVYTVNNGLNQLNSKTGTLSSGVNQLVSGSGQVTSGLNTLNSKTGTLASGTSKLASGASSLQSGLTTYANGVYAVNKGANQLNNSTSSLQSKVGQLLTGTNSLYSGLDKLNGKSSQLATGATTVDNGVSQLQTGAQTLAQSLSKMQTTLNTSNSQANKANINKLTTGLSSLNTNMAALEKLAGGMSGTISGVQNAGTVFKTVSPKINTEMGTIHSALQDYSKLESAYKQDHQSSSSSVDANAIASAAVAAAGSSVTADQKSAISSAVSSQVNAQTSSTSTSTATTVVTSTDAATGLAAWETLSSQLSELQAAIEKLDNSTGDLSKLSGLSELASQSQDANSKAIKTINQLESGITQIQEALAGSTTSLGLVSGSNSLTESLATLKAGTSELASGLNEYTNGVSTATTGASTINNGVGTLNSSIPTLTSAISAISSGTSQLATNTPTLTSGATKLASGTN